jgi:16S rRNA (uracil1498-N3)-methyltransferase
VTTRRFFAANAANIETIILTGDELFHLRKVNRAKAGEKIEVVNGKGSLFFGRITKIDRNQAEIVVEREENEPKPAFKTIIAPSLIKKKAMTLMIEKLTEIGIDEIRPVLYTRTDEKYSPSLLEKWQRIAGQALKINKKLWLCDIYPPVPLKEILKFSQNLKSKILLDKKGEKIEGNPFYPPVISIIGPPGDFTAAEKESLLNTGFVAYNLNDCVLKTETAAISIAAILKTKL